MSYRPGENLALGCKEIAEIVNAAAGSTRLFFAFRGPGAEIGSRIGTGEPRARVQHLRFFLSDEIAALEPQDVVLRFRELLHDRDPGSAGADNATSAVEVLDSISYASIITGALIDIAKQGLFLSISARDVPWVRQILNLATRCFCRLTCGSSR